MKEVPNVKCLLFYNGPMTKLGKRTALKMLRPERVLWIRVPLGPLKNA